jgi:hypothetical protein
VRRLALAAVAVVAVAWPGAALAAASPVAEIIGDNGEMIARANPGAWSSEDYGYSLQIGSSSRSDAGVELRDVSILGGRLRVARLFVPASGAGGAQIEGLTVDGNAVSGEPNTLVQLGSGNYAMVLQEAVLPGRLRKDIGLVGLRVVLGSRQLLVGLVRPPVAAKHRTVPWSLFGLAPLASVGGPATSIGEPILMSGGPIGDRAVSIAMQFLGVPYVWAGASPFSGFDCSGLTMYVYAQLGIHLIHFAGAQYNEGTRIPIELLAPGDLVFFEPGRLGPGHVGIYIGAGEFIAAPHSGDVVRISALTGKYALSYVGAVRPYGP